MKALCAVPFALLLAACGGGNSGGTGNAPPPVDQTVPGRFVLRLLGTAAGYAALEEAPAPYHGGPPSGPIDRRIRTGAGDVYAPPAGWSLIDAARHPSGALSAVLASPRALRLVRLDGRARPVSDTPLADAQAPLDPYYDQGGIRDDASLAPLHTRDAVRLATLGEDLAVALRTGRHAVVAYRFAHTAQGGYAQRWRSLVEPGTTVMARHLAGGSHDTYGQLANHFQVLLAADAQGGLAVAVPAAPHNGAFAAHAAHYGVRPPGGPELPLHGAIVTRLDGQGRRLGTTFFDTGGPAQVYALRALPGGWALAGRQRVAGQAGGWNGFGAWLDAAGRLQRRAVLDVDQDDVLFDIAALPDGRHLVAGATGYRQNPAGASISDHSEPLLAVLGGDGAPLQRLPLPAGPGQNPVLSLAPAGGPGDPWLVAGMRGGPGTHTADADASRLRADGYVRTLTLP